jgi:phosphatidylserine/phosphatidylglycerophosphate/cardiolipin synthase-like enzyme
VPVKRATKVVAAAAGQDDATTADAVPLPLSMSYRSLLFTLAALPLAVSAQTDRIRVYFNQDTDPAVSSGTLAISLHQAMDDTIEAYIDRAQYTVDVAVYNADDFSIISALNQADDRGVQVRYIAEGTNSNSALANLSSTIPVLYRTDGEGSGMHNKFMSIDADHADIAWTWTGSTNWTQNGLFDDYNNMVFIQDQALALAYRTEFEEMWGGTGPQPNTTNSRFGADKTNNTPHSFNVDGVTIECYFSPSDGTTSHIVDAIDGAEHNARSCMFSFTNEDIGSALLDAHQRPDVIVQMDLEDAIYSGTEGWYLESNGVEVATHNTDLVQLHHKYGIIDEGSTDDPLVITGSHNWTWYAETINDENIVIIHDATVANLFYQEWHARHDDVAGVGDVPGPVDLAIWPQPVSGVLNVRVPETMRGARIRLIDTAGREVLTQAGTGALRTIDLSTCTEGVYALVCEHGQQRIARTVSVTR